MTVAVAERHGYRRYKSRKDPCRCFTCRLAARRHEIDRLAQIKAGTWAPFVDAEPVREHVKTLMAAGFGRRRIAVLAGCEPKFVTILLFGKPGKAPTRRVTTAIARAVLAIAPSDNLLAGGATVGAVGTHRRIQALACLGWPLAQIVARIGMTGNNLDAMMHRDRVLRTTADKIRALYDELSMLPGPAGRGCTRIKRLAVHKGWFPPLAWDDEDIDNPAACPVLLPASEISDPRADELSIQHHAAGHTTGDMDTATRNELIRRLLANDWTPNRIAAEFGVSPQYISQVKQWSPR